MKNHALFVNFEKSGNFFNCRLLQIIGGALRVSILFLILKLPCVGLQCVTMAFPDHTHLLFF